MINKLKIWLRKIGILPKLKSKRPPKIGHDQKKQEEFLMAANVIEKPKENVMDFTSEVKSIQINVSKDHPSYPSRDFEYDFADAYVKWSMSIEARSWGVKSIYPFVREVDLSVEIKRYTDDEDEYIETIEISEENGWQMTNEFGSKGEGLAPNDIYIDFVKKVVEVEF